MTELIGLGALLIWAPLTVGGSAPCFSYTSHSARCTTTVQQLSLMKWPQTFHNTYAAHHLHGIWTQLASNHAYTRTTCCTEKGLTTSVTVSKCLSSPSYQNQRRKSCLLPWSEIWFSSQPSDTAIQKWSCWNVSHMQDAEGTNRDH